MLITVYICLTIANGGPCTPDIAINKIVGLHKDATDPHSCMMRGLEMLHERIKEFEGKKTTFSIKCEPAEDI